MYNPSPTLEIMLVLLSRERLFAQLRSWGIRHLGMVKRLYLEANGSFSLVENKEAIPGLNNLPEIDPQYAARKNKVTHQMACFNGGNLLAVNGDVNSNCSHCADKKWINAVL